jgi:hypothetical protein
MLSQTQHKAINAAEKPITSDANPSLHSLSNTDSSRSLATELITRVLDNNKANLWQTQGLQPDLVRDSQ